MYHISIKEDDPMKPCQIFEIDFREEIGSENFSFADTDQSIEDFIKESSRYTDKVRKYLAS